MYLKYDVKNNVDLYIKPRCILTNISLSEKKILRKLEKRLDSVLVSDSPPQHHHIKVIQMIHGYQATAAESHDQHGRKKLLRFCVQGLVKLLKDKVKRNPVVVKKIMDILKEYSKVDILRKMLQYYLVQKMSRYKKLKKRKTSNKMWCAVKNLVITCTRQNVMCWWRIWLLHVLDNTGLHCMPTSGFLKVKDNSCQKLRYCMAKATKSHMSRDVRKQDFLHMRKQRRRSVSW